ncbi:hypothetical protein CI109_107167 [Kwoniella shandongensis]|uniref:Uncharacterized protein n=1 Tax=Kwoniella shandongensis TaxID=1734106 RepID=A0A5M6C7C3_9TREE|nr:uncharacterized protein CI109_002450 [Kwoniella shandongensis]KAA5529109.1 hypothetical protein CI109_002450 [Kwoniella shandongensis]
MASHTSPTRKSADIATVNYVPAHRTDEDMFKRRYIALQDIIHELEDENNLIAYRIAKLRKQASLQAIEKEKERKRALKRAARARAKARDALIAEEKAREEREREQREQEQEQEEEEEEEEEAGRGQDTSMSMGQNGSGSGKSERVLKASYLDDNDEEERDGRANRPSHLQISPAKPNLSNSLSPLLNNPSSSVERDAHDRYERNQSYDQSPTRRSEGDVSMEDDY